MELYDTDTWYVDFVISITKNKRRGKNPQTWKVTYASDLVEDVVDNSPAHTDVLELLAKQKELSHRGITVAYVATRPSTAVATV